MGQQLDCCKSGGNSVTNGLFVSRDSCGGNQQDRMIRSVDDFKRSNNDIEDEEGEEGGEDEQEEEGEDEATSLEESNDGDAVKQDRSYQLQQKSDQVGGSKKIQLSNRSQKGGKAIEEEIEIVVPNQQQMVTDMSAQKQNAPLVKKKTQVIILNTGGNEMAGCGGSHRSEQYRMQDAKQYVKNLIDSSSKNIVSENKQLHVSKNEEKTNLPAIYPKIIDESVQNKPLGSAQLQSPTLSNLNLQLDIPVVPKSSSKSSVKRVQTKKMKKGSVNKKKTPVNEQGQALEDLNAHNIKGTIDTEKMQKDQTLVLTKEESKKDEVVLKADMTSELAQHTKVRMNIKNFAILQKKEIRQTYKIKETLGQGSFGCVKRVLHRDLNEDRALKIIKKSNVTSESDFANEIGMLKSIDHPNVLKYYECYKDDFNYYIVTEFCTGGELLTFIVKERGINDWQAAFIMKQVLSAVNYCHQRGIVHRDLKVENILVKDFALSSTDQEYSQKRINIKLIDFGISCRIKPKEKLNKFFGTPYYMAPEVIKRDYNEKCDLWSCGVILYIIMCGYPPFRAQTLKGLQQMIMSAKYDFKDSCWQEISQETKDLIKKLLVLDVNRRLSAKDALSHPFFETLRRETVKEKKERRNQMGQAFQNLRNFNAEAKIQTALKAFLANFCINDDYEQALSKVFQEIDRNRDGTISKGEFKSGTYQFFGERTYMLEEEIDRMFDLVDLNGNGLIDYSEFISSAANVNQLISDKQMKAAFKAFDLDGSGEISFQEFQETFAAGLEIDKEELRTAFLEFDDNKSGLINYEEFKGFMKKIFKVIMNKQQKITTEKETINSRNPKDNLSE